MASIAAMRIKSRRFIRRMGDPDDRVLVHADDRSQHNKIPSPIEDTGWGQKVYGGGLYVKVVNKGSSGTRHNIR